MLQEPYSNRSMVTYGEVDPCRLSICQSILGPPWPEPLGSFACTSRGENKAQGTLTCRYYAILYCTMPYNTRHETSICYARQELCYTMLYYAILSYAMLCCAMLHSALLCYAMLNSSLLTRLCHATKMACYSLLCDAVLTVPCCAMSCYLIACYAIPCQTELFRTMPRSALLVSCTVTRVNQARER